MNTQGKGGAGERQCPAQAWTDVLQRAGRAAGLWGSGEVVSQGGGVGGRHCQVQSRADVLQRAGRAAGLWGSAEVVAQGGGTRGRQRPGHARADVQRWAGRAAGLCPSPRVVQSRGSKRYREKNLCRGTRHGCRPYDTGANCRGAKVSTKMASRASQKVIIINWTE